MFSKASLNFFSKKNRIIYKKYKKKPNLIEFIELIKFGLIPRPQYALGLLMAAHQAKQLGYKKISVFELGNFNLDGLIDIEHYIDDIKKIINIDFCVFGLDYRKGLPNTKFDKRDRMYGWSVSDYKFTLKENLKKLKYAKLIVGDIKNTIPKLVKKYNFSLMPVAFVVSDVDYYTSTLNGLNILKMKPTNYVPRPIVYFDDQFMSSHFEGEYLAIKEFNKKNKNKLSLIGEFAEQLSISWKKWIFLGKRFYVYTNSNHPKYNQRYYNEISAQINKLQKFHL